MSIQEAEAAKHLVGKAFGEIYEILMNVNSIWGSGNNFSRLDVTVTGWKSAQGINEISSLAVIPRNCFQVSMPDLIPPFFTPCSFAASHITQSLIVSLTAAAQKYSGLRIIE